MSLSLMHCPEQCHQGDRGRAEQVNYRITQMGLGSVTTSMPPESDVTRSEKLMSIPVMITTLCRETGLQGVTPK